MSAQICKTCKKHGTHRCYCAPNSTCSDYTPRLMAVWKYDMPPYYLAAEVIEVLPTGSVRVEGYDCCFEPVKILPYDEEKISRLKLLEAEYDRKVYEFNQTKERYKKWAEDLFFLQEGV